MLGFTLTKFEYFVLTKIQLQVMSTGQITYTRTFTSSLGTRLLFYPDCYAYGSRLRIFRQVAIFHPL